MGENALALLLHLSSPSSPLPSLTKGYAPPTTVFISNLGTFISYSYRTAKILYTLLFLASLLLVRAIYVEPAPALRKGKGVWREQVRGCVAVVAGVGGAVVGANLVAVVMVKVLGKGMSWFSNELSTMVLYGPAALAGSSPSLPPTHLHITHCSLTTHRRADPTADPRQNPRTDVIHLAPPPPILPRVYPPIRRHRLRGALVPHRLTAIPLVGAERAVRRRGRDLVVDVCARAVRSDSVRDAGVGCYT
jgi:hypothetical protein